MRSASIELELEGALELGHQLRALGGPKVRQLARRITNDAMAPVLSEAKAGAPVGPTGRLRASLGKLAKANARADAFTSRVGTRRDFVYRSVTGIKLVSGRGKVRERALAKGRIGDTKTAQQYARLIEFGEDKSGKKRRRAGPAHFLENAIRRHRHRIESQVFRDLRQYVESPPSA